MRQVARPAASAATRRCQCITRVLPLDPCHCKGQFQPPACASPGSGAERRGHSCCHSSPAAPRGVARPCWSFFFWQQGAAMWPEPCTHLRVAWLEGKAAQREGVLVGPAWNARWPQEPASASMHTQQRRSSRWHATQQPARRQQRGWRASLPPPALPGRSLAALLELQVRLGYVLQRGEGAGAVKGGAPGLRPAGRGGSRGRIGRRRAAGVAAAGPSGKISAARSSRAGQSAAAALLSATAAAAAAIA